MSRRATTALRNADRIVLRPGVIFEVWEVRAHPMADRFPDYREVVGYQRITAGVCGPQSLYVHTDETHEVVEPVGRPYVATALGDPLIDHLGERVAYHHDGSMGVGILSNVHADCTATIVDDSDTVIAIVDAATVDPLR